jgi:hypothetical protein
MLEPLVQGLLDVTSRIFRICESSLRLRQLPRAHPSNFAGFPFLAQRMLPISVSVLWGPDHQPGIGGRDERESLGYTATSRRNSRRMGRLCQRVVHRRHLRHHLRRHDGGSRTRNTSAPWLWPCRARWRGLETAPPKPKEVIGRPRTSHERRFSLRVRGTKLAQFSSGGVIYRLASIPPCHR